MKKRIVLFAAILLAANVVNAASQHMVWGEANQSLPQFKQASPFGARGLLKSINSQQSSDYQLKLANKATKQSKHARYQITYKGIPVWGHQLVFHAKSGAKPTVTGLNVNDIEKDITSVNAKLSTDEVEKKILASYKNAVKYKIIKKVIFIDNKQKANLAYHLSFYVDDKKKHIKAPNYLIDANNGNVLKEWNGAHYKRVGQGMGGNSFPLPYRPGMFQHGDALPSMLSLGKFDVQVKNGQCHVQNGSVRVVSLRNAGLDYDVFPISVFDEEVNRLNAFSYACDQASGYINYADGVDGPVNYSFSPINDTMYFAQKTIDMYSRIYKVKQPLGDDLPLRAYTHLGGMDNAFAIPTIIDDGELVAHQQIIIGNGDIFLTAPAQAVIGHELSHNFTELNSGLIYEGQSGAINEAFSDMAAIALQDYLRQAYPWYWDGEDWTIGREAVLGAAMPLRYMDEPTKDGFSISHADNYSEELDVHFASGVFNKAFYLLSHKPGWSVRKAFQMMVDANQYYWSPIAYYDFAACGVIQAAIDRDIDEAPVIEAFAEVGVTCPMHKG